MIKTAQNNISSLFISVYKNVIANIDGNLDDCSISLWVENKFVFINFKNQQYEKHTIKG